MALIVLCVAVIVLAAAGPRPWSYFAGALAVVALLIAATGWTP